VLDIKIINKSTAYAVSACLLGISPLALAQGPGATDFRPESSVERPGTAGKVAHTHLRVVVPAGGQAAFNAQIASGITPFGLPPYLGYLYETPASLGCVYGLTAAVTGCNPNTVTANPVGGSKAIAIVDAYNYPKALADLQKFSTQFGLAAPNLTVVYANGVPVTNDGWGLEAALDIQWAHAMAPGAKLYLVLAKDSSFTEMMKAVDQANTLVAAAGGGQVSMSWGSSEFSGESTYDSHFQKPGVVYFASAGDTAGTSYPSTSPYVVSVGGTTLSRSTTTGALLQESAWSSTGGGPSLYYGRPVYQNGVAAKVGTKRGSPDVSLVADPVSGGWVYYTNAAGAAGWYIVGGTSWSSPAFAGIVNAAGHFAASTNAELTTVYANLGTAKYKDITAGFCGPAAGYLTAASWDFCTGVGSDKGYVGK